MVVDSSVLLQILVGEPGAEEAVLTCRTTFIKPLAPADLPSQ